MPLESVVSRRQSYSWQRALAEPARKPILWHMSPQVKKLLIYVDASVIGDAKMLSLPKTALPCGSFSFKAST